MEFFRERRADLMGMNEYLLRSNGYQSGKEEAFELYCCGKRTEARGHRYGPESREYFLFVLIRSGHGQLLSSPEKLLLAEQHLLVMFPDAVTHYYTDPAEAWNISWIGLGGTLPKQFCSQMGMTPERPVLRIEKQYDNVQEIFDSLIASAEGTDIRAKIHTVHLILRLFDALAGKTSENSPAEKLTAILDALYRENITITDAAEELHIHPGYLSGSFRTLNGVTPKAYLLNKKIGYAKELIAHTELSIQEIASAVGISDPLYFSRLFRKYCGMPPSEYIEKN